MEGEEIEICPVCSNEISIKWDVEKEGYQITCTECGEKIMLCDACLHSEDNKQKQCDWTMERECFRKRKESSK